MDIGLRVCGGNVPKMRKRGYSPPGINREEVNRLKELCRRRHPEEFSKAQKSLLRGYLVKPLANLPPS
jgi:hypothetical protein